jgi:sugar transferase (PEP-CTERM/EpsH1 system associated)
VSDPSRPELLLLCHRIPYPPDKGDKIRSYRWWTALCERYRVHLGAFVDDPDDWVHAERLERACESLLLLPLPRRAATLRSLWGLASGEPLTLPYYRDRRMAAWVDERLDSGRVALALVYCSAMAQYVTGRSGLGVRRAIDFVDLDSDKWRQYAERKPWPIRWVYRREARRLGAYERAVARELDASLFVSPEEAAPLRAQVPEVAGRVGAIRNGVDTDYFDPAPPRPNPFPPGREAVVFTGAMDYWANVDAVVWLVREVWPRVRAERPQALLAIVGARPSPQVQALAGADCLVTGRVEDVRPYLAQAQVVVAPLRIARGIQNKVLEGMAMARPVVVTSLGLEGIPAEPGVEVLVADGAQAFAAATLAVLAGAHPGLGERARRRVAADFSWAEATRRLIATLTGAGGAEGLGPVSTMNDTASIED